MNFYTKTNLSGFYRKVTTITPIETKKQAVQSWFGAWYYEDRTRVHDIDSTDCPGLTALAIRRAVLEKKRSPYGKRVRLDGTRHMASESSKAGLTIWRVGRLRPGSPYGDLSSLRRFPGDRSKLTKNNLKRAKQKSNITNKNDNFTWLHIKILKALTTAKWP